MTNESAAQADKAAGKAEGVTGTEGLRRGPKRQHISPAQISALSHAAFRAEVNDERRDRRRGGRREEAPRG